LEECLHELWNLCAAKKTFRSVSVEECEVLYLHNARLWGMQSIMQYTK
jgi:hypothetical protein